MRSRAVNMAGFTLLPVILAMSLIAAIAFLLNRDNGMNAGMAASQSDADRARYAAEAGLQAVNAIVQGKNCNAASSVNAAFGADSYTVTVDPASGTPVTLTATGVSAGGASASLTRANVVAHQAPIALTLQPGISGLDTSIRSPSPNNNYGADASLSVQSGLVRALVLFDLASIPVGSAILSAQLSLYHTVGGNDTVSAFRVTNPWTEGTGVAGSGATWNIRNGATAWTAAGGDFDPSAGVAVALSANNTWTTWDLTSLTAAWIAGTLPNNGIALVASGAGGANSFVSSDDPVNTTQRPKLDVTYALPCGWVPPAPTETVVTLPASQDTWISEANMGSNFGNTISFRVTNAAKRGRGLVKFDLSSIPAGTVLRSARLRLFTGSFFPKADSTLTVNRVTNNLMNAWTENGATWKKSYGMTAWSMGFGGTYDLPAAASTALLSSTDMTHGVWVEWDVTALAQDWYDRPALNYGAFVLIDTSSAVAFNSSEATFAPLLMPQLVITY